MRQLIVLFFVCCCTFSFSQKSDLRRLEKLKNEIRQATYYDSLTVFKLGKECIQLARKLHKENEIGLVYQYYGNFNYFSSDIPNAKKYYAKSVEIARKTNDFKLKNSTEIRLAFIQTHNDIQAAEKSFRKLLIEAKKNNYIENQIEIYNGLGLLYNIRLRNDKAIQCYLLGLRISEKHHKDYFTGFLLNNLGLLKLESKQYASAKKDLERALFLATKSKESRLRFNTLNNLGLVDKYMGNIKGSIKHYRQTVIEAKKIGFPSTILAAYVNLASAYLDNDQINEASQSIDSAMLLITPNLDSNYPIALYLLKGLISIEQKQFEVTDECIAKAKSLFDGYQDPGQGPELLLLQAKLAAARGNFKDAYRFEKEFHELSDSIRVVSNEEELARQQTIYGKERMENRLLSLNQKNKILKTESELKTTSNRFVIILFVTLFLLIGGGIYTYSVRKSRKDKALFSQRLIEQIDEERSRISKDLHDDIGQSLAVVKSKLNLYATGKITQLGDLDLEVGDILEQTRMLSHQLHPAALEKIGLERSLNSLIERAQSGTDMVCSLDYELDTSALSLEASSQIYRIIQECISNTIKHAQASALKVSCLQRNQELTIEYRDNGIGFSEGSNKHGLGLQTIRERIMILGGKLDIKSGVNKGVQLTITI